MKWAGCGDWWNGQQKAFIGSDWSVACLNSIGESIA